MNRILAARDLAPGIREFRIEAPKIAAKHQAGQFVILRATSDGERIPITIAESADGCITIIVQAVGKTTTLLNRLGVGDVIADIAGPLGRPTDIRSFGSAVTVGGGVGTAIAFPVTAALKAAGNTVRAIVGARSRDHVILEDRLRTVADEVLTCTDDGSYGYHGFVTGRLQDLIDEGTPVDYVFAVGPIPMMRAVADVTRPYGIETVVSLNPVMVDGTGMCGGCRVEVGGATRFACIDGPEFDAHEVDFDLLTQRNSAYGWWEGWRMRELEEASP